MRSSRGSGCGMGRSLVGGGRLIISSSLSRGGYASWVITALGERDRACADPRTASVEEALQLARVVGLERVGVLHRDVGEPRAQPLEPLARHGVRHAEPLGDLAL